MEHKAQWREDRRAVAEAMEKLQSRFWDRKQEARAKSLDFVRKGLPSEEQLHMMQHRADKFARADVALEAAQSALNRLFHEMSWLPDEE